MKSAIVSLALLGSLAAHADMDQVDVNRIDIQLSACIEESGSTAEKNKCVEEFSKAVDLELSRVYNSIRTQLLKSKDINAKETLKRLIASKKAWMTFRDADCDLVGTQMLGGTGEGPMVGGCLVSKDIARIKELQSIFLND